MSADEFESPGIAFGMSWLSLTLILFPAAATLNVLLDTAFSGWQLLLGCILLSLPGAIEVVSSGRHVRYLATYVIAVTALWLLVSVIEPVVYLLAGIQEAIPSFQVVLITAAYLLAYLLVYRGGYDRIRNAIPA